MLLKVETTGNEIFYLNENQITYIEKVDVSVPDEDSTWRVHLVGEATTVFDVGYAQLKQHLTK
ncbi:hypothetical protein [Loigolactobacillus jiayinensis]|uniref:Uncharacterized protein n=1 Tax=Loigolactobacillus jiayinensis TaxID=2486016 RepID=A0ABW1RGB9_9LACO|nr:hypothetical protein [Loigolactobacillus jiayinensis]